MFFSILTFDQWIYSVIFWRHYSIAFYFQSYFYKLIFIPDPLIFLFFPFALSVNFQCICYYHSSFKILWYTLFFFFPFFKNFFNWGIIWFVFLYLLCWPPSECLSIQEFIFHFGETYFKNNFLKTVFCVSPYQLDIEILKLIYKISYLSPSYFPSLFPPTLSGNSSNPFIELFVLAIIFLISKISFLLFIPF